MAFKLPSLSLKAREVAPELPKFEWSTISKKEEIGRGAFGIVYKANKGNKQVVVKMLKGEGREDKLRFVKEARLLHKLSGHQNIVNFYAFSNNPYSLMLEYCVFDFKPFKISKEVSTLDEFLGFLDVEELFASFYQCPVIIAEQIISGLSFLHSKGIAHRDFKPQNILISNSHYANCKDEEEVGAIFSRSPLVSKLSDFGESRAIAIQTFELGENSRTCRVQRGTKFYMAPELIDKSLLQASLEDLMKADIWSLGLTLYCIINPDVPHPYVLDMKERMLDPSMKSLKSLHQGKVLPAHSPQYEAFRVSEWWKVDEIIYSCCDFVPSERPSTSCLVDKLKEGSRLEDNLDIIKLSVSQESAIERLDRSLAHKINDGVEKVGVPVPLNDGRNSCMFLCLAINEDILAGKTMSNLPVVVEKHINTFPQVVNTHRDVTKLYSLLEAYELMRDKKILRKEYVFTEEFITMTASLTFTEAGRKSLEKTLMDARMLAEPVAGIYVCEPYAFILGYNEDRFFLIDTHPISTELGGNDNGLIIQTQDNSKESCKVLTQWILRRLRNSGVSMTTAHQSFAWMNYDSVNKVTASNEHGLGGMNVYRKRDDHLCNEIKEIQSNVSEAEKRDESKTIKDHGEGKGESGNEDGNWRKVVEGNGNEKNMSGVCDIDDEKTKEKPRGLADEEEIVREDDPDDRSYNNRFNSYGCRRDQEYLDIDKINSGREEESALSKEEAGMKREFKHGGGVEAESVEKDLIVNNRKSWESTTEQKKRATEIIEIRESNSDDDFHNETVASTKSTCNKRSRKWVPLSTAHYKALLSDSSSISEEETFHPNGEPYQGDVSTPVFSWGKTSYSCESLVRLLSGKYEPEHLCISQPVNVANNVSFLLETAKLLSKDDAKCDDMGAWKHNGSPKTFFHVTRDDENCVSSVKSLKEKPKDTDSGTYMLKRLYYTNVSSNDVRKVVSTLQDDKHREFPYTFVQYLFKDEEHEIIRVLPHGNSKNKKGSYRRLFQSTKEQLKSSVNTKHKTTKELLDGVYTEVGDVTSARSLGQLPRGPKDIYNARYTTSKKCDSASKGDEKGRTGNQSISLESVWMLLERAKQEEATSEDTAFIRECTVHPDLFVILASDRQLEEMKQFCTDPREFCIYGIDPTFNVFHKNISLTVTTYRNLKLQSKETKKPPVFIGPLLMHQHKDWKIYSKFSHALTTLKPELEGVLACETDGEKALIDGFKRNFRFALFLRCFIHFKDNVKRELTDRCIDACAKREFMEEIFGRQEGEVKYFGLVDCESDEEFDRKLENLKEKWEERENVHGNVNRKNTFFKWFVQYKVDDMKESMLKCTRTEAGLGNPPKEYTNNDPEAANFMIKHGLNFDAQKPHEFILQIKKVIETQYRNVDRAVFGMGPYEVQEGFKHLVVDDKSWGKMTHQQRMLKVAAFQKTTIDGRREILQEDLREKQPSVTNKLSVTALESGIKTVPMPILEAMFEKANSLLSKNGSIIPKPCADDGSFIVSGNRNNIYCVTPGKGASLHCDKTCINSSTKICEHVLAVAQILNSLNDFLSWFKRSRKTVNLMDMALGGGPKTAGKKPSKRKKSNVEKPPVTAMVDLLQENEEGTSGVNRQHFTTAAPNTTPSWSQMPPVQIYTPPVPTYIPLGHFTQTNHSAPEGFPNNMQQSIQPNGAAITPFMSSPSTSAFTLKWLYGTRVSRCYGCGGEIVNPPLIQPDDLICVYRDIRQYRDRHTGQLHFTNDAQNVHFHLRAACIKARYPHFNGNLMSIPPEYVPMLQISHRQRLTTEFGLFQ